MLARRERPFRASSAIARYDGFVAKFMGDGILAYFGFPRAHEDNAERAVHAGLEIAEVVAGLETRAGTVELRIPKLRKGSEPSRAAADGREGADRSGDLTSPAHAGTCAPCGGGSGGSHFYNCLYINTQIK
jgi:hypothetical protein